VQGIETPVLTIIRGVDVNVQITALPVAVGATNRLRHVHRRILINYPTSTRRHGNFAGVHTLLRIILSSNSAVLINIITGV
jgi:hypothetical protein